jgi:hypothetical protein
MIPLLIVVVVNGVKDFWEDLKRKKSDFGLNYSNLTTHCIRKSVITELNLAKQYTSERIHYLVGHADNSIEAKHYLKFKLYPERSTRDMLEYMEELTNMRFFFNAVVYNAVKATEILNERTVLSDNEVLWEILNKKSRENLDNKTS